MSPLLLLSLVLQAACCVHVVRSGRPLYWIFILLAFSLLAVLVYVCVAVIPDLRNDPTARRGLRKVRQRIDPQREQRDASRQLEVADTPRIAVASRRRCWNRATTRVPPSCIRARCAASTRTTRT